MYIVDVCGEILVMELGWYRQLQGNLSMFAGYNGTSILNNYLLTVGASGA